MRHTDTRKVSKSGNLAAGTMKNWPKEEKKRPGQVTASDPLVIDSDPPSGPESKSTLKKRLNLVNTTLLGAIGGGGIGAFIGFTGAIWGVAIGALVVALPALSSEEE